MCFFTAMEQGPMAIPELRGRTILGVSNSIFELLPSSPKGGEDAWIYGVCKRRQSCEVLAQAWEGAARSVYLH